MQRIVVGIDASDGARRALEWSVDEAKHRDAIVEAVHVWQLPYVVATPFGSATIGTSDYEEAALEVFGELVDAVDVTGLVAPIERTFLAGHPANMLLEQARGADLLVVGARGHGGFKGMLLGSVSQQVTHHAPCPVVIVPGDDA